MRVKIWTMRTYETHSASKTIEINKNKPIEYMKVKSYLQQNNIIQIKFSIEWREILSYNTSHKG